MSRKSDGTDGGRRRADYIVTNEISGSAISPWWPYVLLVTATILMLTPLTTGGGSSPCSGLPHRHGGTAMYLTDLGKECPDVKRAKKLSERLQPNELVAAHTPSVRVSHCAAASVVHEFRL
jgi:hypothetical protein